MLKDPEIVKEVQQMMNDPKFKEDMKLHTQDPKFQEALKRAGESMEVLESDPVKLKKLKVT